MASAHFYLLILFLVLAAIIAGVFIFVYRSSLPRTDSAPQQGLAGALSKRILLAVILGAVAMILLTVTLARAPYYAYAQSEPASVVFVYAHQFAFILSDRSIDPMKEGAAPIGDLPVGVPVEFRIASLDVNHGFVLYGPDEQIVAQAQAMPGYVNRLRWQFDRPGTYEIRCLEYCGFGHTVMSASLTVR